MIKHAQLLFVALVISLSATCQQEWQYSQYVFNLYDVNSAFAGAYGELSLAARFRTQWVGFDGAPVSQGISAHLPLGALNGGIRTLHERIGARSRISAKATVAYPLELFRGRLSFALNAGMVRDQWDVAKLSAKDPDEALLSLANPVATLPTVDFAVFYQSEQWYAGAQMDHLNGSSNAVYDGSTYGLSRHVQLVAGAAFHIAEKHAIRPSALLRAGGSVFSGEVDLAWLWDDKLWLGAGYRLDFGLIGFAQYQLTEQLRLGYAYDYATGPLATFQQGSHEVFLGWNLPTKTSTNRSIRYFR